MCTYENVAFGGSFFALHPPPFRPIYWSRGGVYREKMELRRFFRRVRAGPGTGYTHRRGVSGGLPDVPGGVSAHRLRRGMLEG